MGPQTRRRSGPFHETISGLCRAAKPLDEGKDGAKVMSLPAQEFLSPFSRNFLNQNFKSVVDLAETPSLLARLHSDLERDNEDFRKVQARVLVTTARGVSYYDHLTRSLHNLASEIDHVRDSNLPLSSLEDQVSEGDLNIFGAKEFGHEGDGTWDDLESSEIESIMNPRVAADRSEGFLLNRRAMVEELEALASEVARVERMRTYAESVLKLEQLVGDLEASIVLVSGSGRATSQVGSAATSLRITRAVQRMQSTENAVAEIAGARWNCFVSAVDLRVDRVAAILRPAAIADHRVFLTSIGWPPPLSAASAGGDKLANPLLDMSEDQERKYCQSFMALAILQAVQQGRRERQLNEYQMSIEEGKASPFGTEFPGGNHRKGARRSKRRSPRAPLWVVEELINPVASKAEPHFVRWTTKPELVFALAYRIAQEYVDVIDDFLQPLIDQARVAGFSAREEWVFSLVGMVSRYLQTHVLPGLANDVQDKGGVGSVGAALWLHIVDQALAFDNRMKSLAVRVLGLFQEGSEGEEQEENLDNMSGPVTLSISAIADRPDWLALWAKLELEDVLEKLKADLQTDVAWDLRSKSPTFLGLVEGSFQGANGQFVNRVGEFRAPIGADFVLSSMSAVTDRCRNLSEPDQQYGFIKDGVMPIAREYVQELLGRCQELEALTALVDEGSMVKVSVCVNAARYCEHALQDWGEDVFFLELLEMKREREDCEEDFKGLDGSIFDDEIGNFKQFRQDWVGRLVSSISRGFEARCREYLRNKKRWLEAGKGTRGLELYSQASEGERSEKLSLRQSDLLDENHVNILKAFDLSASLVDALAVLQSQLSTLQAALDNVNFFEMWSILAKALDQLLINTVVFSGTKFSEHGGWQFAADIQALFLVFKPYCVRPSGFFRTLHDAVRLLTLTSQDAVSLIHLLTSSKMVKDNADLPLGRNVDDSLKHYGVRKLPPSTAIRVLNCRMLPKL